MNVVFFHQYGDRVSGGFRTVKSELPPVPFPGELAVPMEFGETPFGTASRVFGRTPPLFRIGGIYCLTFYNPDGQPADPYEFTDLDDVRRQLKTLASTLSGHRVIVTPLSDIKASVLKAGYRQIYAQFSLGDRLEVSFKPDFPDETPNYAGTTLVDERVKTFDWLRGRRYVEATPR